MDDLVDSKRAEKVKEEARRDGLNDAALFGATGLGIAGAAAACAYAAKPREPSPRPRRRPDKLDKYAALLVAAYFVARS